MGPSGSGPGVRVWGEVARLALGLRVSCQRWVLQGWNVDGAVSTPVQLKHFQELTQPHAEVGLWPGILVTGARRCKFS